MPNTIAENLQRLIDAKEDIADAITAKGGTVGANDGLEEFASDIATIPSGSGGSATRKDVNFYDYDGTIVNSYTATEFAELSAMPANPTHEGLTAQGWNWSLADAKSYVADYGSLNIGQMYITSDGKTRIYISLPEGRTSPILQLYLNANSELDIDWGDGSTHSTFTSTTADYKSERHVYAGVGDYVIVITVISGGFVLRSSASLFSTILWNGDSSASSPNISYNNAVKKVEIGNFTTSIGDNAFNNCLSLIAIAIPNSITSVEDAAFRSCLSLPIVNIPNSVNTINNNVFESCQSLFVISIPNSITSVGIFSPSCTSLTFLTLPNLLSSIGGFAFRLCKSLSAVSIPNSVTSIGTYAFDSNYSLSFLKFNSTTPPTIANISAWGNVPSDCYVLVPLGTLDDYLNTTNMPDDSTYLYLCYAKYASGAELPTTSTDGYTLTWYATKDDARNAVNPITVGNNKEIFAVGV